jgi:hypothetical protein
LPASGVVGDAWFVSLDGSLHVWDGAVWVSSGALAGGAAGAGLFRGNNGETGDTIDGLGDIFRVHGSTLSADTTIGAGENAMAAGPITVASGVTLTVSTGGSLVIA